MKYISKSKEPKSLTEYRSTPNASFDNCNKEDIRLSLLKEQGYICAYCMDRINDNWNKDLRKYNTEIEHYKSQDVYNGKNGKPDLRLNYNNMLAVCNGNAGMPKYKQHCDKSKDLSSNKQYLPLTINPLDKKCEKLVKFLASGKISSENEEIKRDLVVVLNLNERELVKARKIAIDEAIGNLDNKNKKRKWSLASIKTERKKWANLNDVGYEPYCQAVINYLDRKIQKIKKSNVL